MPVPTTYTYGRTGGSVVFRIDLSLKTVGLAAAGGVRGVEAPTTAIREGGSYSSVIQLSGCAINCTYVLDIEEHC
jgi:hypothetical protein